MIHRILTFLRASRVFLLVPLWACLCFPAQARRKDVVVMNNGDHFTGEVKRLEDGLLLVETDYVSGNIGLDWNQVESVQSTATYHIVLNNGQRLAGRIEKVLRETTNGEDFLIHEATEEVQAPSTAIVKIDSKSQRPYENCRGHSILVTASPVEIVRQH